ncbi:MAG: hypothetical protein IJ756_07445 [Paludibacteraceae bacterium]|nr:hypothetical protein [Paludibacteraceae bacterium]
MKRVFFVAICLLAIISVFAEKEEKCYTVDRTKDTVVVSFPAGCTDTIFIRELFDEVYGYDYSSESTQNINYLRNSIYKKGPIKVLAPEKGKSSIYIICNDSLYDKTYYVYQKKQNDQKQYFTFIKSSKKQDVARQDTTSGSTDATDNSTNHTQETQTLSGEKSNKNKEDETQAPQPEPKSASFNFSFVWLVGLTVCFVALVIYVLNKMKQIEKKIAHSDNYKLPREIENLPIAINALKKKILNKEDILVLINTEISNQKTAFQQTIVEQQTIQKPIVAEPVQLLDTNQVDCDWNSDYLVLRPNDKPVFRIHQEGNTYYYTLTDEIKSVIPSMLSNTERFIAIEKKLNIVAQSAEVVQEGIVAPEGNNRFRVDPNNKLKINLI